MNLEMTTSAFCSQFFLLSVAVFPFARWILCSRQLLIAARIGGLFNANVNMKGTHELPVCNAEQNMVCKGFPVIYLSAFSNHSMQIARVDNGCTHTLDDDKMR